MTRFGQTIATGIVAMSAIGAQAQTIGDSNEVSGGLAEQRYVSIIDANKQRIADTLLPRGIGYYRLEGHESRTHIIGTSVYNKTFGGNTQLQIILGGYKEQNPQNGYSEIRYGGAIILR